MDNMSEQWDKTHLCRRYNENDCEFFLQTGNMETVLDGHKLAKCCYYCTSENKVRKIGSGGSWTGLSPKFCPKRKNEKGKNENMSKMSKRCQELFADSTAPEPQEDKFAETDKPKPTYKEYLNSANDNTDTETADLPSPPILANTENPPAPFDYSELDSDTADKLRAVSEQVISIKATYVIETAKQVKAAHDLLANHYKGLFGAWCESVGFTRQTGNNLVHVAETFPDLTLSNAFDNISARLLYEASKPSAPKELVEQVKNGDITTHKDYIALKKELDEANKRAEDAESQAKTYQQNFLQMDKNYEEECERNISLETELQKTQNKNTELELQLKAAESRPHDTYYDVEEVNRRVAEAASKLQNQTAQQIAENHKTYSEKIDRMQSTIDELENELAEANVRKKQTDVKIFAVKLTLKNFGELLKFIDSCDNAAVKQAIKKAEIIKID